LWWVSVVVVVVGPGTVVDSEVVVVLCVGSLEQAESAPRATTTRHGMISLFIAVMDTAFVSLGLWGVDLKVGTASSI
jgi:hypothetical protein